MLASRRFLNTFGRNVRSINSLVVAEHDLKTLSPGTLSAITAATKIGGEVTVLVMGNKVAEVAQSAASLTGVNKVVSVDNERFTNPVAEDLSNVLLSVAGSYSHILAASSNGGKNFLPRTAALMDASPLTDIISVIDQETFKRPMYAGSAIATVKMTGKTKFLLVRATAFEKAAVEAGKSAPIEAMAVPASVTSGPTLSTSVSQHAVKSARPELTAARVVVSGGRAMKNGENFGMLETLADKLGGAVGASRAAVDAGYVPSDLQIGQTGKVVAPDLYIACGISGAIQHLSGMKDSKTIVVINKDKEAPFFSIADYGLVEDLFKAVPEMNSKL